MNFHQGSAMLVLMSFIDKNCQICSTLFRTTLKEHRRGNGKYCSKQCVSEGIRRSRAAKAPEPNVSCVHCNKMFYRNGSKLKNSKSGLQFCSRSCKDSAQRIGGIVDIMPPHYGTGNGSHDYRERAFAHYPSECADCGWNLIDEVLEVHHIDRDRSNNEIDNLKILCPTCHRIDHFFTRTGSSTRYKIVCEAESSSSST